MDANKLGEAHRKAVNIIDCYAKSHYAAKFLLAAVAEAEIRMLKGETPERALFEFADPLASHLLKIYNR